MGVLGKNDLGQTEEEPISGFGLVATAKDVRSWARLHWGIYEEVRDKVREATPLASKPRAEKWLNEDKTEAVNELREFNESMTGGFTNIWNWGPLDAIRPEYLMDETIANAVEGQRLLDDLNEEEAQAEQREKARELEEQAKAARVDGDTTKANELEAEAQSKRDEATLMATGQKALEKRKDFLWGIVSKVVGGVLTAGVLTVAAVLFERSGKKKGKG